MGVRTRTTSGIKIKRSSVGKTPLSTVVQPFPQNISKDKLVQILGGEPRDIINKMGNNYLKFVDFNTTPYRTTQVQIITDSAAFSLISAMGKIQKLVSETPTPIEKVPAFMVSGTWAKTCFYTAIPLIQDCDLWIRTTRTDKVRGCDLIIYNSKTHHSRGMSFSNEIVGKGNPPEVKFLLNAGPQDKENITQDMELFNKALNMLAGTTSDPAT